MSGYWDRPCKNVTRQLAAPISNQRYTLWLPGEDVLDVENACKKRLLHRQGKHIVVERDQKVAATIRNKLATISDKYRVNFQVHEGPLHQLTLPRPLQYAHFDFCGGLSPKIADWIFDKLEVIDGADIHFTFAYALRGSRFLHQCDDLFAQEKTFNKLESYQFNQLERNHRRVAFYCALIGCMLNRFDFDSLTPIRYKDTVQSMVLYSCCDVIKRKTPLLEQDFRPFLKVDSKRSSTTSSAAQKAWETRRRKKEMAS